MVGVLSACVTKRTHYDTPEVPLPASFKHAAKVEEDESRKVAPIKNVLPDWWRLLNSPELNELVDRALANNHDLRIASNRIAQASARVRQARADQLPSISIPYSANITAPTEGVGLLQSGAEFTTRRTYQVSVRADWRPDLWGEMQSLYESAELQLWRATFARDDAQRALTSNVVSLYSNYLSLCDRLRIAEESETVLSGLLASVRERMNSGDATIIEFEQQRAAVFQVRATIPQLQLQRDQTKNRLANLVGTVPAALHLSERGLDSLSYPVVETGLPSALLLRRPDVRALEATMLAADANIDTARARIFPQMDISAQYGVGGFALSQILSPARVFWNGLASLTTSIFDYGKRSKEVEIARSVHEELVETYVQTLYNAVREVEDAQAGIAANSTRLKVQQESVTAALAAWTYSRESYDAGAIDYMVLLDTERNYHARLDELNRIRLEQCLALVELFQSLGGGVDTTGSQPVKGKRLMDPPDVNVGLVQSVYTIERPSILAVAPKQPIDQGKQWLVELPGMASYPSVMAARRDLYNRFPDLMTRQRIVLVRQEGKATDDLSRERASWYRMFVGAFPDVQTSERFCAVLKTQFMRCNPLLNTSSAFANGGKWLQLIEDPVVATQMAAPHAAPVTGEAPTRPAGSAAPATPATFAAQTAPLAKAPLPAPSMRVQPVAVAPVPILAEVLQATHVPIPVPQPAPAPREAGPMVQLPMTWEQILVATSPIRDPSALPVPAMPPAVAPTFTAPDPVAPSRAQPAMAAVPPSANSVPAAAMAVRNMPAFQSIPMVQAAPLPIAANIQAAPAFAAIVPLSPQQPAQVASPAPARDVEVARVEAGKPMGLKLSHHLSMPLAAPLAMPPLPSARVGYSVQVYSLQYAGRFTPDVVAGLRKRFERSIASWQERGYAPYLYKSEMPGANVEIAICIGNFARPEDAAMLADQLRERGQSIAVVVPVDLHRNGEPMPIDATNARLMPAAAVSPAARLAAHVVKQEVNSPIKITFSQSLSMLSNK